MTHQVVPEHQGLILETNDPVLVLQKVPTAFRLGPTTVGMPHTVEEVVRLTTYLHINVPSPILYHYRWPRERTLIPQPFEHQLVTAGFVASNPHGYVLNDIGTGKTLTMCWVADYLISQGFGHRVLVAAPLSTLERVWGDTLFVHFQHRTFSVLHGSADRRRKLLAQPRDFYVINHDGVGTIAKELAARTDIDIVIIDEIAVYRNKQTNKWKVLESLIYPSKKPSKPWVWGLTGTPIPNSPEDAYGQCRLVTPTTVPKYFTQWRNLTMDHQSTWVWTPRAEATEMVYKAMRPSIRFKRDDCLDLPPVIYQTRDVELSSEQQKHYKEIMRELFTEVKGGRVTAMNEGVKLSKLLQIACIMGDTPVLTDAGWVPIRAVTDRHKVWDGIDWVSQRGARLMGLRDVEQCCGVWMTADHRVLTTCGWKTAKEISYGKSGKRFSRKNVRLPDRYPPRGHDDELQNTEGDMGLPVPVRGRSGLCEPVSSSSASHAPAQLWMSPRKRNAQDVELGGIQHLGKNETTMWEPCRQGLEKLRGAWNRRVRTLAGVVQKFLAGCWSSIPAGANFGQEEKQPRIFQRKLSLGNRTGSRKQQANECTYQHAKGGDDCGRRRASVRLETNYHISTHNAEEFRYIATSVYDLIDCGPRSQFVVLGNDGPLIVHNCGVVYDSAGVPREIDAGNRIETLLELIESINEKVIIFVPFTAVTGMLARELSKHWRFAVVTGDTPVKERNDIFAEFQDPSSDLDIIAHPGTMSHGLTLTEASTIIWYAPIDSNDVYQQANGRITRAGQHYTANIVNLAGSTVERRMYKRLQDRQKVQGVLLEMVERGEQ